MPEGPEVLMMTKILTKLKGKVKISVFDRYLNPELKKYDDLRKFSEKTHIFKRVFKKGKHTFVEFLPFTPDSRSNGEKEAKGEKIIIHLRYGLKGEITTEKTDYVKLVFEYGKSEKIYFSDQIGYGDITVLNSEEITEVLDNLGPSIENIDTYEKYRDAISLYHGKKPIAELLVNQSYISGIGNYLRSEILYAAGVYPIKKAKEITDAEHLRIFHAIKKIWSEVIAKYPNYKCKAYENPKFESEKLGSGLVYYVL